MNGADDLSRWTTGLGIWTAVLQLAMVSFVLWLRRRNVMQPGRLILASGFASATATTGMLLLVFRGPAAIAAVCMFLCAITSVYQVTCAYRIVRTHWRRKERG